jgi:hypothetical protein
VRIAWPFAPYPIRRDYSTAYTAKGNWSRTTTGFGNGIIYALSLDLAGALVVNVQGAATHLHKQSPSPTVTPGATIHFTTDGTTPTCIFGVRQTHIDHDNVYIASGG